MSIKANEKKLKFVVDKGENLGIRYIGDEVRISQILTNLLSNAIKFTPEKGTISVESEVGKGSTFVVIMRVGCADEEEKQVYENATSQLGGMKILFLTGNAVSASKFGKCARDLGVRCDFAYSIDKLAQKMKVADAEQKPYDAIFIEIKSFKEKDIFQLEKQYGELIDHSKIVPIIDFGLERIEQRYFSKYNITTYMEGPVFSFSFYNTMMKVAHNINTFGIVESSKKVDFSRLHMLLVEDIEINSDIVIDSLEYTGINIDIARDGLEAVEMFKKDMDKYDIVLMDVQMPVMNGLDATRSIRELPYPKAKEIPIISMTANVFKEDIEMCLEAGMNDHLGKPIDAHLVVSKIITYTRS